MGKPFIEDEGGDDSVIAPYIGLWTMCPTLVLDYARFEPASAFQNDASID